ncbi:hypothetical protein G3580_02725 [Nitrogeniibacter mangrovi]|uniref:DUF7847 domain-containing protein n=1 Tax=Nitrogeniibacter mangrovi TaxID=2016596 RepID=A0A6C1AZ70_9RHOO|nr:BPSS1780 family membrane protein [Nitrogeniibacter mangrovi]QID16637.1 hypothetical protein G3580_02725 [Nitrogeniibacter mangrovi]
MTDAPLPSAVTVSPARCLDWLAAGWRLFLCDPARWAVVGALFVIILVAIGVVPLIGWAITLLTFPVLGAGLVAVADEAAGSGRVRIEALFDGLRADAGKHVMVGVFHLVAVLVIGFVAALIGASAALTGALIGPLAAVGLTTGGLMLAVVVFTALWLLVIMALWFAPALIRFHGADPIDALTHSVDACLRNLPVCFVLALALYVLAWVAVIPAGLGLVVLIPVIAGAHHAAYLDIFAVRRALPGHADSPS